MSTVCGGYTPEAREVTAEVAALATGLKTDIERAVGATFVVFEPRSFVSQVVAGTNYRVTIDVGDGRAVVATVFAPLPHTGNPAKLVAAEWSSGPP